MTISSGMTCLAIQALHFIFQVWAPLPFLIHYRYWVCGSVFVHMSPRIEQEVVTMCMAHLLMVHKLTSGISLQCFLFFTHAICTVE